MLIELMRFRLLSVAIMLVALSILGSTFSVTAQDSKSVEADFKVVCFGDSITGHRPNERFSYQKHYVKYADLLGMLIQGKLSESTVQVINSGWSGDTTYPKKAQGWPGAEARVKKDILDFKPDIAIILISGNDGWKKGDEAARVLTKKNLTSIMKQCKDAGIKTLVMTYPKALPAKEHEAKAWNHLSAKNETIREVAEELGLPVLDLDPAMQAAAKRYPREQLADPKDGVHLRPRGEMVFASAIYAKLKELGWLTVKK